MENQAPKKNQGGRPQRALTPEEVAKLLARPELQQVLAETAKAAAAQAVATMTGSPAPVLGASSDATPAWAGQLAAALSQVADPRKKPLDPVERQRRIEARARMNALIDQAVANDLTPEYELTRECYIEEQLIMATYIGADRVVRRQVIGWTKAPNQAMVPINDVAREIHGAYLESVGGVATEGMMPPKDRAGHLKVFTNGKLESIPEARMPNARTANSGSLSLRGHALPGQVIETAVLGSVHAPARQLA